jgi:hypothetical protein
MDKFLYQKSTNGSSSTGNYINKSSDLLSILMKNKPVESHSINNERTQSIPTASSVEASSSVPHKENLMNFLQKVSGQVPSKSRKSNTNAILDPSFLPKATAEGWAQRDSKTAAFIDISCSEKQAIMKAKNYVGWKMDSEGNRVYTTFRNGGKVQVSGQEAFRLALADGNINQSSKKRKSDQITEYVPSDTSSSNKQAKSTS